MDKSKRKRKSEQFQDPAQKKGPQLISILVPIFIFCFIRLHAIGSHCPLFPADRSVFISLWCCDLIASLYDVWCFSWKQQIWIKRENKQACPLPVKQDRTQRSRKSKKKKLQSERSPRRTTKIQNWSPMMSCGRYKCLCC